jgi:hypothetical protein
VSLPLFPVTTVGSWPRSEELLKLQRAKQAGRLSAEDFEKAADEEVREFVQRNQGAMREFAEAQRARERVRRSRCVDGERAGEARRRSGCGCRRSRQRTRAPTSCRARSA